jgi:hypothetical protein
LSGAASWKVSVVPSADQVGVPVTTGPASESWCRAMYMSSAIGIACEKRITIGAVGSTPVAPPGGITPVTCAAAAGPMGAAGFEEPLQAARANTAPIALVVDHEIRVIRAS